MYQPCRLFLPKYAHRFCQPPDRPTDPLDKPRGKTMIDGEWANARGLREAGQNLLETDAVTAPSDFDQQGSQNDERGPWEMLGISEPALLDDRLAPRVDREFLQRFVGGELPEPAADAARRLVVLFPSWREAHKELLAQVRARRNR
jgi:hypothetical protein